MAAETGFMIDGSLYEMPSLDSFTMDEAQVLFDYSGLALEDFVSVEDETPEEEEERAKRLKNPGLMRALMHIAYQRGNPKMAAGKVRKEIGHANVVDALEHLGSGEEEEGLPPASTTEPETTSPSNSVDKNESSGTHSQKSSPNEQDENPTPIGTLGSESEATEASPSTTLVA